MTANEKKALQINACKVRMGVIEGTTPAEACPPPTCSPTSTFGS